MNDTIKLIATPADVTALFKTLNRDTKFYMHANFDGRIIDQQGHIYADLYHVSEVKVGHAQRAADMSIDAARDGDVIGAAHYARAALAERYWSTLDEHHYSAWINCAVKQAAQLRGTCSEEIPF